MRPEDLPGPVGGFEVPFLSGGISLPQTGEGEVVHEGDGVTVRQGEGGGGPLSGLREAIAGGPDAQGVLGFLRGEAPEMPDLSSFRDFGPVRTMGAGGGFPRGVHTTSGGGGSAQTPSPASSGGGSASSSSSGAGGGGGGGGGTGTAAQAAGLSAGGLFAVIALLIFLFFSD